MNHFLFILASKKRWFSKLKFVSRVLLVQLLTASVIVSLIVPPLAMAQVSSVAPGLMIKTETGDAEFKAMVDALDQKVKNPGATPSHFLDLFGVLDQAVYTDWDRSKAEQKRISEMDYRERMGFEIDRVQDFLTKNPAAFNTVFTPEELRKAAVVANFALPEQLEDIKRSDIQQLLTLARTNAPLCVALGILPEHVEIETFINENPNPRFVGERNIWLEATFAKKPEVVAYQVSSKSAKGSAQKFFKGSPGIMRENADQGPMTFHLSDKHGRRIHSFFKPIEWVTFYGNFLVFQEENAYDETSKKLTLKFIDLSFFQPALGNAPLPIFSVDLKSEKPGSNAWINQGRLVIDDAKLQIDHQWLMGLSRGIYQPLFNVSVGLADPRSYSSSAVLVKSMVEVFQRSVGAQDQMIQSGFANLGQDPNTLTQMSQQHQDNLSMLGFLSNNADLVNKLKAPIAGSEATDSKSLSPLLDQGQSAQYDLEAFTQVLANQDKMKAHLLRVNHVQTYSRKLMARINLMIHHLAQPQPLGGGVLLKSLLQLAASKMKRQQSSVQHINDIKAHPLYPYLKYGSVGLSSALLSGAVFTDSPLTFIYQSLDVMEAIYAQVKGYLEHIGYGHNFIDLAAESAGVASSSIPSLGEQYVNNGRYTYSLTAAGAVFVSLVTAYAVPHFTTNFIRLAQWKKQNSALVQEQVAEAMQETLSPEWGSFKKLLFLLKQSIVEKKVTFILSVEDLVNQYNQARADDARRLAEGKKAGEVMEASSAKQTIMDHANAPVSNLWAEQLIGQIETSSQLQVSQASLKTKANQLMSRAKSWLSKSPATSVGVDPVTLATMDQASQWQAASDASTSVAQAMVLPVTKQKTFFNSHMSFIEALKTFTFSYPSLTLTFTSLGNIWGNFFISRSLAYSRASYKMLAIYPKFFSVAAQDMKKVTVPSLFNGGELSRGELRERNKMMSAADLQELVNFEKSVVPLEQESYRRALELASNALLKFIEDPKTMNQLISTNELPRVGMAWHELENLAPSIGVTKLSSIKLKSLPQDVQAYFRSFAFSLSNQLTINALKNIGQREGLILTDVEPRALKQQVAGLNQNLINQGKSGLFKAINVPQEIEQALSQVDLSSFDLEVRKIVEARSKETKELKSMFDFKGKLLAKLDPTGNQMGRYLKSRQKLGEFAAAARAVRNEIAGMFVDTPMRVFATFVMYAGVLDGSMLQPIHDEMFGPNSFFYASRYLVFNEFVLGTILGVMANTWFKVAVDARQDDAGSFDKLPMVSDQKKGFWRYVIKSGWKNPSNTWAANHLNYLALVWYNIPAALITITILNMVSLGRLDLGAFMAGYLFIALTPLTGIGVKIEQSFELASSWVAGQIPYKLRTNKVVLDYIQSSGQKKRFFFNIWQGAYSISVGTITDIMTLANSAKHGSRAFLNLVLYGYQPEELISKFLQKVVAVAGWIPGVEQVARACESALTRNNTALDPAKLFPKK